MNPVVAKKGAELLPTAIGLTLIVAAPLTVYFVTKGAISDNRKNNASQNATNAERPEFYAVQLQNALANSWYWWGVDEDEIYRILRAMPNRRFFDQVSTAYFRLAGETLMQDLRKVGPEDFKVVIKLIEEINQR